MELLPFVFVPHERIGLFDEPRSRLAREGASERTSERTNERAAALESAGPQDEHGGKHAQGKAMLSLVSARRLWEIHDFEIRWTKMQKFE